MTDVSPPSPPPSRRRCRPPRRHAAAALLLSPPPPPPPHVLRGPLLDGRPHGPDGVETTPDDASSQLVYVGGQRRAPPRRRRPLSRRPAAVPRRVAPRRRTAAAPSAADSSTEATGAPTGPTAGAGCWRPWASTARCRSESGRTESCTPGHLRRPSARATADRPRHLRPRGPGPRRAAPGRPSPRVGRLRRVDARGGGGAPDAGRAARRPPRPIDARRRGVCVLCRAGGP